MNDVVSFLAKWTDIFIKKNAAIGLPLIFLIFLADRRWNRQNRGTFKSLYLRRALRRLRKNSQKTALLLGKNRVRPRAHIWKSAGPVASLCLHFCVPRVKNDYSCLGGLGDDSVLALSRDTILCIFYTSGVVFT